MILIVRKALNFVKVAPGEKMAIFFKKMKNVSFQHLKVSILIAISKKVWKSCNLDLIYPFSEH